MIAFVKATSTLTDFSIGSVVRTILEASSLEDDEQYFQMVQLLDVFNIRTSSGVDLDARMADLNLVRIQPTTSVGFITIQDGSLITDNLAFDSNATDTTVSLDSTTRFPVVGFPYTIRIGEGTTSVEDIPVSANNVGTGVLTVLALVNAHALGAVVSVVTGAADITISSGLQVSVPASGSSAALNFLTSESGTIVNGNLNSTRITTKAVIPGIDSNIGRGQLTKFTASSPFSSATVTNDAFFSGGGSAERDRAFQNRGFDHLQSLSNATPLALKSAVLGVSDPVTGRRISSSSAYENFSADEVIIYVDDGSGFIPDQTILAKDQLDTPYAASGQLSLSVTDAEDFPSEGFILISPESAQAEVLPFSAVDYSLNNITVSTATVNTHDSGDEVVQVEILAESSDAGLLFFSLRKSPVVRNSFRIWVGPSASSLTLQTLGTDYYLNKARGRIEFLVVIPLASYVVITYSYYTGLIYQAQKFINGSPDTTTFPGIVAAGIETTVETPTIRRITVRASITARNGIAEEDLVASAQAAVESYIVALGIGEDIILSEIIERIMGVSGVFNVSVQLPTSDVSVPFNELPLPFASSGTSLVTIN
ncbi:MAG: baseplate J/gp47 family protein [Sulfurovum sp.]|nr:baseplate J/gp47 family protein [Sulfurovum sp.]